MVYNHCRSTGRYPMVRRRTVLIVALLFAAPFVAANAAASGPDGTDSYRIVVGTEGPQLRLTIDIGLLANFGTAGRLGVQAVGTVPEATGVTADGPPSTGAGNETVLRSRFGVDFAGVGDPVAFAANPFDRFTGRWQVAMHLPFDGAPGAPTSTDDDYRSNGTVDVVPVNGSTPVGPTPRTDNGTAWRPR
jgi:hypothetical protein